MLAFRSSARLVRLGTALALATSLAAPLAARADSGSYVRIPGVAGFTDDTMDPRYPGAIYVTHWSWGVVHEPAGTSFDALEFTKPVDRTTPAFFSAAARGTVLPAVHVYAQPRNDLQPKVPTPNLDFCVTNAVVVHDALAQGRDDDRATEDVTIRYRTLTERYTPYDALGNPLKPVVSGWSAIDGAPLGGFPTGC